MKAIIVIGNVCAGKSEFIAKLSKKLVNYEIIQIDDYHREHSHSKEAWKHLIVDALNFKKMIIECSGASKYYEELLFRLKEKKANVLVVKIETPKSVCFNRFNHRPRNNTHLEAIFDGWGTINFIHEKLQKIPSNIELDGMENPFEGFKKLL